MIAGSCRGKTRNHDSNCEQREQSSTGKPRIFRCFIATMFVLIWGASAVFGQDNLSVSGITEPIHDVTLSASVPGTVSTIFFKEGAHVNKGKCILKLDKKIEELEVERRKLIWESKVEVNSAAVQVDTLGSLLNATRELFESTGSVSREELENKELEYALAVAEYERLKIAEERERIEYEMALEQMRKRILRSPIQGVIIKLFLEKGENCEEQQPLVHVVDTSKCLFICNIEERIGRTLMNGQSVDLSIQAGSESIPRKGRITFVSPVVDAASSLQEVKAVFDNHDGKVRPGVAGVMLLESP